MNNSKRILLIGDLNYNPAKLFVEQLTKLSKGFIRLGHDVRFFSYCGALGQLSPFKSKNISKILCKEKVDKLLTQLARGYDPHIVFLNFPKFLNNTTISQVRKAVPNAVFIGFDGDPWPHLQDHRISTAQELDILTATNDGSYLQFYKDAGIPNCTFLPNFCDPDTEFHYEVKEKWKSDIVWVGKVKHSADTSDDQRERLLNKLEKMSNCSLYGCFNRKKISGLRYLYALSGAKIGLSINAMNSVKLYHSDRLTHLLSCGCMVLSKYVPGSECLFEDHKHLRYFDDNDEFFELADWYLDHEEERQKIADAGMQFTHEHLNHVKIAGYILDLAEHGSYQAPWTQSD